MKNNFLFLKIFTAFLIVTTLFFCRSGLPWMPFMAAGEMNGSPAMEDLMPCCDMQTPVDAMTHEASLSRTGVDDGLLLLAGFLFVVFSFGFQKKELPAGSVFGYIHSIRRRYGSWRLFDYFVSLFQTGILHAKTW